MVQHTVIIICGPTAVGKTGKAIQLAQLLNTEIISADSRQCFKELNIGVAKPALYELSLIPHHFINSHSITDEVNAIVFEKYALQKVATLFVEKQTVVMVGGTGLYIKAFCEGMDEIPDIDPAIRQKVIEAYNQSGLHYLQNELKAKDPNYWHNAEQQNPQRLMRALEVILSTGFSITHFRQGIKAKRTFDIVKIGLELPRELLYTQINNRVDQMIEAGLIDEVKKLYPYKHLNALQTVGYTEVFDYLDGKTTLANAIEAIKKNTRHYAKRQMTWFKKDPEIRWFATDTPPHELLSKIEIV